MIESLLQVVQVKKDLTISSNSHIGYRSIEEFTISLANANYNLIWIQIDYPVWGGLRLSLCINRYKILLHLNDSRGDSCLLRIIDFCDPNLIEIVSLFTSESFIQSISNTIQEYTMQRYPDTVWIDHINAAYIQSCVSKLLDNIKSTSQQESEQ